MSPSPGGPAESAKLPGVQQACGSWSSPISAAIVASQGLRLGAVAIDGADAYWVEGRAGEGGRNVLVRCGPEGTVVDVTPAGFNVRTRVHEYGGAGYIVSGGEVYFSNFADQRIYRIGRSSDGGSAGGDPPNAGPGPYA